MSKKKPVKKQVAKFEYELLGKHTIRKGKDRSKSIHYAVGDVLVLTEDEAQDPIFVNKLRRLREVQVDTPTPLEGDDSAGDNEPAGDE